ncbi:MAG: hypothetical protein ABI697_03890 [Devosia sp.]
MADKKPTTPPADVTKDWQASQGQKSSASNFRMFAIIAWIIAIAGEIYGGWMVYFQHAFNQGGQTLLLGILIGIAVFAIAGNLFWKAANRRDPARAADKARFFFQNQLGAIISVIAFLPLLILIFTDKDMDPRTRGVASSVGGVLVVLAAALGISFQPPSVEQYTKDMNKCASEIKAGQPTTDCSPEVAAQAKSIANDTSTVTQATNGQDVVYWIAPANGAATSDVEHVFHLCTAVSPLKDKTVNSGSVTEAYAQNATRITQQIAMEQKQCGFTAAETSSAVSAATSSSQP